MGLIIPQPQSFTVTYNIITNVLATPIYVFEPFDPQDVEYKSEGKKFNAIWDTGATGSVITEKVVRALNLKPIGKSMSKGIHGEAEIVNAYLVNIGLPNNVGIAGLRVTECKELTGPFDVLIGMDVIRNGDLAITNSDGKTTMSFRMPSIEKIDFVKTPPLTRQQRRKIARNKAKKQK